MWVTSLGLVLLLQSAMFASGLFEVCNPTYTVSKNQDLIINSPGYPNKYPSGSNCLTTVRTTADCSVRVKCSINMDKSNTGCSSENMYVSSDADPKLRGAKQYCGSGDIQAESEYSSLSFAYVSTAAQGSGVGGRFTCTVSAVPRACDCGWSLRGRIVGGTAAQATKYPSAVALVHKSDSTAFCDGTIISEKTVITAAHCVLRENKDTFMILVGYTYLSSSTYSAYAGTYLVSSIKIHPNYNQNTQVFDIALLITATNIQFSRGVGPMCLPLDTTSAFEYYSSIIIGWGSKYFAGPVSKDLLEASVTVITNADCQQKFPAIQSSQLCTYGNGRDACQFDSGGPVIYIGSIRQYLLGIISYGRECGGDSPGVNTRITFFIQFITQNSEGLICPKPIS